MTELVMPNDTNSLGHLFGGRLMELMDICASIAAQRHSGTASVTASVDSVVFKAPIKLNDVINLIAVVNRSFRTSMEVQIEVWAEKPRTRERILSNTAFFTFVAVDENYRPTPVRAVLPETKEELERYEAAEARREMRLVTAGRMKLEDAIHIKEDLMSSPS